MERIRLGYLHSLELITIKLYYVSSQFEVFFFFKQVRCPLFKGKQQSVNWESTVPHRQWSTVPNRSGGKNEVFFLFLFFPFIFISWRLITLQYCSGFCHTLT